jgi:dipeptidyl aminopeptidase/acylaminoacyl peptidase
MTGKIFLSYRREDTAWFATALFGRLEQSFPVENLFMDVEGGIKAGQDFVQVILEKVGACDVMLALIGPSWLTLTDESGRPRIDNPDDFVHIEVESALRFGKRVIPVLVQKTEMPRAEALPEPLKPLARRNAVGLTHDRFKADAQGLIKALEAALAEAQAARGQATTETAAAGRAAEEAAKVEEAARADKERARLEVIAGLSSQQIARAEELANWDFIKASESSQELRDHLARFPQGVSERMARTRLEALVWAGLAQPADMDALKGFLAEFPKGARASEANAKLVELKAAREAAEREKQETDSWTSASAAGTRAALEDFLRDWPQGKYADRARTRIESGLIRTFAGHTNGDKSYPFNPNGVESVAFSPDGRSALSGSSDKTLKLWDVATGKEIRTFAGHTAAVNSVAFSPDGRSALSGSNDRSFKLWDIATGKEIRSFVAPPGKFLWWRISDHGNVNTVAFSPDGRSALSGSYSFNTLKLWDVATGNEIRTFTGHSNDVHSVAFSPDGRSALSASDDKTLKLWDVATGKRIRSFAGHGDGVRSVAFSPDGRSALSGSLDRTLKLWDVATGKEIRTFTWFSGQVFSAALSPDGRSALSGGWKLQLWDVATGKEIRTLPVYNVHSVAFSPDGRTALSGGSDGTLTFWDLTGL